MILLTWLGIRSDGGQRHDLLGFSERRLQGHEQVTGFFGAIGLVSRPPEDGEQLIAQLW